MRTISHVPFPAQAAVITELAATQSVLHIVPQDKDAMALMALCRFLNPEIPLFYLPAWDTLPYDRVSPASTILSQRLATLSTLANMAQPLGSLPHRGRVRVGADIAPPCQDSPPPNLPPTGGGTQRPCLSNYILISTLNAVSQKLPPRALLAGAHFTLRKGGQLNRDALSRFLAANGYQRVGKVMEAGEYAIRGSLMDIFPAGESEALRIDLFGDDIESIKRVDPLSQLSGELVAQFTLHPVSEVMLSEDTIDRFRTRYREAFGAVTKEDPLYEAISAGRAFPGMEHWLPFFYESLDSIAAYVPNAAISLDYRIPTLHEERTADIADYYDARKKHEHVKDSAPYHPIAPDTLFLSPRVLATLFEPHPCYTLTPFAEARPLTPSPAGGRGDGGGAGTHVPRQPPPLPSPYGGGDQEALPHEQKYRPSPQLFQRDKQEHPLDVAKAFFASASKPIILAAATLGSAERLRTMFELPESALNSTMRTALSNPISLSILPIEQGYETPEYLLLTEQDIFGERIIRTQKKKRPSEAFMQEAASLMAGELIVHREHGIGKFEELVTVEVGTTKHDCLKLIYDGGDKLFLPVENIDLISRYGSESEGVSLDKLGGVAWQKRKSGLKKRLKMAAEALMKVAAERAARTAPAMTPERGAYDEFCARFPYAETEDQLNAITDVLNDLASGRVMDRLICGDVGFGKTEVAMRAAFVAAASGHQVAIIAPTTLLARQHYHNFRKRFEGLPFTVRMLSRLTSSKDAAETKKLLPEGKVDIVIGTHALLAAGIQFKNLGLLIVDEEQHFGVAQKEKLKTLKSDIHVLTLSATPIPRTLQLSLAGVRELSLIATPPVDRLAVRSYVMPYDPVILREAILREYHRGGKIFYVTPRVKYMAELEQKIKELVPEIKIAAAHGKMAAMQLDKTMNAFYDGAYDLLLSTAIIESGIDIPTANTMIIDRPQLFGLAQLYQLRGRVGRSKTRAYAYFTLPHHKLLSKDAERRLEVMQQLDSLGAGFALASHDMDIRGFGNLLGEEQSGHIKEVGIELYQAMLEEAVADLKRKRSKEETSEAHDWSPQINLGMSVLIPESYIEDLSLRLSLYRRAAGLESQADLTSFAAELTDRFGKPPVEVEHLLAVLGIKILCKQAGIARLDMGPKGAVIAFNNNQFSAPEALIAHIAKHSQRIKLRSDQTLFIAFESQEEKIRLTAAQALASEIVALIAPVKIQAA